MNRRQISAESLFKQEPKAILKLNNAKDKMKN